MVQEFLDDDTGYLAWTRRHPRGFVLNCARNPGDDYLVLHHADCYTIGGGPAHPRSWTTSYQKVCAESEAELQEWARSRTGSGASRCGACWT